MTEHVPASLNLNQKRLLSIVYFSSLAIILTIGLYYVLLMIGARPFIPLHLGILLSVFVAAIFSYLFAPLILSYQTNHLRHAFGWSFLMIIVALPIYDIGFLYLLLKSNHALSDGANFQSIMLMYLAIILYSFVLVGLWLAPLAGIAGIFLRHRILTYLGQSLYERRQAQLARETVIKHKTVKHGQTVVSDSNENNE